MIPSRDSARLVLRGYAGLFLACGLLFVFAEGPLLSLLSRAGTAAGFPPLAPGGPSLWLGLTGSLMAAISLLAFRLADEPDQPAAWEALLLSKAVSSSLFLVFARRGGGLFAASAAVDALILVHLLFLRSACLAHLFYDVRFARVNDPKTGRALWVRYERVGRETGVESTCAAVFFDATAGVVAERRWSGPAQEPLPGEEFRLNRGIAAPGVLEGCGDGASWDLRWAAGRCAPASVVPPWLRALGLSRSGYVDVAPDARFSGEARLDGERWDFSGGVGCVGRVWGARYGAGWWWAHAVFEPGLASQTVLELLTAAGPLGTRVTSALLWRADGVHESSGPVALFRNRSRRDGDRWSFRARFGSLTVEGDCALGLAATLDYRGPDGRRLVCRNSKVSPMRATLTDKSRRSFSTASAAVEFVEAAR